MKKFLACIVLVTFILIYINYRNEEITICAVGDIMLDRGVERVLEIEGYDYPYKFVKNIFKDSDITVGNLEGPLFDGHNPVYKSPIIIFNSKTKNTKYLKDGGINLLNIANNHTLDHKEVGLISTMDALDNAEIEYFGGGKVSEQESRVKIVSVKGQRIGFLGFSTFPTDGYISTYKEASIEIYDEDTIELNIKSAKDKCDFLIVSYHWGKEYERSSSKRQRKIAKLTIDYGADLIIGHHPHVLQEQEIYKEKYIFYSLGNFIFDKQIPKHTDESIILKITIQNGRVVRIDKIPIEIVNGRPIISNIDSVAID